MYSGHEEVVVEPTVLNELRQNRRYTFEDREFMPNEYLFLRTDDEDTTPVIGRIVGEEGTELVPILLSFAPDRFEQEAEKPPRDGSHIL